MHQSGEEEQEEQSARQEPANGAGESAAVVSFERIACSTSCERTEGLVLVQAGAEVDQIPER